MVTAVAGVFDGNGMLAVSNKNGKQVIYAGTGAGDDENGRFSVRNKSGQEVIYAGTEAGGDGDGLLSVSNKSGQGVIIAGTSKNGNGGYLSVWNKTEEEVINLKVDDYGNGEVGAWNRKGKGRVWSSQ